MITDQQWKSLLYLKPSDFRAPDKMSWLTVKSLDVFIGIIGSKPQIISDWRDDDLRTHGQGIAVDTVFSALDPLQVNKTALNSQLFSGVGLYVNDAGVASHHFDNRSDRSPENPAIWGGKITHPYDSYAQKHVKKIEYTSMSVIEEILKKKGSIAILFLIVSGFLLWKLTR